MLFPTATFAVFFLIAVPLSWLLMPRPPVWRAFTVVASYVFYGWWDWRYVLLLVASTLANQALGLAIHRGGVSRDGERPCSGSRSSPTWERSRT